MAGHRRRKLNGYAALRHTPADGLAGPSKTEVAARGGRERFGGSDVVVEEGAEVAVAGLAGDPVDRGAVEGAYGGMAGAGRVPSDWDAVEPGGDGACLDEPADRSGPDTFGGDGAGSKDAREECTGPCEEDLEPRERRSE